MAELGLQELQIQPVAVEGCQGLQEMEVGVGVHQEEGEGEGASQVLQAREEGVGGHQELQAEEGVGGRQGCQEPQAEEGVGGCREPQAEEEAVVVEEEWPRPREEGVQGLGYPLPVKGARWERQDQDHRRSRQVKEGQGGGQP